MTDEETEVEKITYKCSFCLVDKSIADDYTKQHQEAARKGNKARCKVCVRAYNIKHRYGVEVEEYDAIMEKQENKCAICILPFASGKKTHVDHNHETGEVRGILCQTCNNGLGHLMELPMNCLRAVKYLHQHEKYEEADVMLQLQFIESLVIVIDTKYA